MRLYLFTLLLPFLAGAQDGYDVLHYRYHIRLSDDHDTMYARAEITVKFLQPAHAVEFNLTGARAAGKGMSVSGVTGRRVEGFRHTGDRVRLQFAAPYAAGDTVLVTVGYRGIPADGLVISKTKYGRRSFFADNWPDRGQNWLVCHDHPADKATVEFLVTAPSHYQVVANGIQVEETNMTGNTKLTHWQEHVPISTKVMVIGVAEFAVQLSGFINNCLPVYSWVYPEDRDAGFREYALAGKVLPFYMDYIGPYPYAKLANVQSKTRFGGLENANTIFYSENSVSGTGKSESLIAHEIAHQWFGNHATEKTFAHLWLSEGFATYMTILYFEKMYGRDTALHMLREDRDQVIAFARSSNRPVVDSLERDYMSLLNANSYQKGSFILHMLRQELGDSLFRQALRNYYRRFANGVAGTEDFRSVIEQCAGRSFENFFRQWLYNPGIPNLDIRWKYIPASRAVEIVVEQEQANLFEFPLEISLDGSPPQKFHLQQRAVTLRIPMEKAPRTLQVDPGVKLLFTAQVSEG